MRYNNQIVAVLLTGLILVSGVTPISGVGTASASADSNCEISPVTGKEVCMRDYGQIDGATVEEIWLSMHVQSESMHDRYARYTVEKASIANLTTGMQTEEGIVKFIQAYNDNGGDVGAAKAEAYNAVNDMASGWQASVAHEQTAQAEMTRVMWTTANGTDGMSPSDVIMTPNNDLTFADRTFTLYNGTDINVTQVASIDTYYHNNEPKNDYIYTYYDGDYSTIENWSTGSSYDSHYTELSQLNVRGPESVNGSTVHSMDAKRVKWTLDIIDDNRRVAIDNVGAFADSFEQYEPGEVSAEEFMSPAYRMRNHATDYQSTGHYAYLLLAAQDRGMAVDIDTGFTVSFTQDNGVSDTIDGGLYATPGTFDQYNGTIDTGIEYNVSDLNGTVWVIDASTSQQTMLNKTFVIDAMRDIDDNTTVNQTTLQDTTFATRSAEDFKQDVQDWEDNYTKITKNITYIYPDAEPDAGSGFPFSESTTRLALVAVILIAGVAILGYKQDDQRGRQY
ncbi:hypothetical protein E2L06_04155 [Haloterrigena sp. H1]|nr:hypothetical protein E2L06_04155 [Haloterrigena sp. H1]